MQYDIARDYFYKGQPRLALDHCRKAIELNDQNAAALYFTSAVYLFFCSGKLELGDPDCSLAEAEKYVRRAISVHETFREAKNTLGQILILERNTRRPSPSSSPSPRTPLSSRATSHGETSAGHRSWADSSTRASLP